MCDCVEYALGSLSSNEQQLVASGLQTLTLSILAFTWQSFVWGLRVAGQSSGSVPVWKSTRVANSRTELANQMTES